MSWPALFRLFYLGFSVLGAGWIMTGEGVWQNPRSSLAAAVSVVSLFYLLYTSDIVFRYRKTGRLLDPESFFVYFFGLFHFSYIILYVCGVAGYDPEVFYDHESLVRGAAYSLLCVSLFVAGYRTSYFRRFYSRSKTAPDRARLIHWQSIFLLSVCLLMFWLPLLSILEKALSDYGALISVGELSPIGRLYWLGQYLGYAALTVYFASKRLAGLAATDGRSLWLVFAYIGGFLLIGDRGGFISYLAIFLSALSLEKKLKMAHALSLCVLLLMVSAVVAVSRSELVLDPVEAVAMFNERRENGPLVSALIEFGSSIKTVGIAIYFIPDQYDYWYGRSFLDSLMNVLPNIFGQARTQAGTISAFVTEIAFGPLQSTWGRGGSIAMESYVNFGFVGSVLFILFGALSRIAFDKALYAESYLALIIFYSSMGGFAMWMRNTSGTVFRIVIWTVLIACVMRIIANSLVRRSGR